jgi:DNA segregation ATPase FtsK/SpoIIIE-like protein
LLCHNNRQGRFAPAVKLNGMKILNKIWAFSLLSILLIVAVPHKSAAQDQYISEQDFYDNLAPYGTWVYDQQYGDVWIPDVDSDFRPYATAGHWVLTEYGNTWVSDYPWGWATFHYGRWIYDDYYGWEWVPGYEWAPAWVSWRHGGGYYGWAPLMPGISVDLSFGNNYNVPDYYWAFAPQAYINSPTIYNYYVPPTRSVTIIKRTTVVRNTFVRGGINYAAGPRAAEIQRYTNRRPPVYAINNSNRPGAITVQNRSVNMFRPSVRRTADARPERVVDANAYRQQNPNQSIARLGTGGTAGYNRDNAARLAAVARNSNDNNNVVRVNRPAPAVSPQRNNPNQNDNGQRNPVTPSQPQNGTRPAFTPSRDRDNPANDLQQKQQQIKNEQKAVREQRRDQWIREGQEQALPQTQQRPAINGQTPLQQQEMALRDQKRQLQRQQQQADRTQQQRLQFEQQKQAQQTAQQQQALQKEQQRAQAESQRQAQQAAQRQATQQAQQAQQAQQKEQQRVQVEQQRQAQQAQQAQQKQAAQEAAQQRQAQQAQQAQQRQAAQQAAQQAQQQQSQQRGRAVRPNQQ